MAKEEREGESDEGEGGVEGHFSAWQFDVEGVGDGFDEGVAWDAEEVGEDLADDARSEECRADEEECNLGEVDVRDEGTGEEHAEVDAESEESGGGDLPELKGVEGAA